LFAKVASTKWGAMFVFSHLANTGIGDANCRRCRKASHFYRELSVKVVYGGTNMGRDVNQLKKTFPTILVATPGSSKTI
jgi:hypothetical protein